MHGVNLGGWLVLERWIKPSLFRGLKAQDETAFCRELGERKYQKLDNHRRNFIAEDDFRWIAAHGLDAVRIPVGHWVFGDAEPYVGAIGYLDWAVDLAGKYDLRVLIDLHTAPGSQNGWDHSGLTGEINWPRERLNVELTLRVLKRLAARYAGRTNLLGVELLNEPHWQVPLEILRSFYQSGYRILRDYLGPETWAVVSDSFRPESWNDIMLQTDYPQLVMDAHLYQAFSPEDIALDLPGHLAKVETWSRLIEEAQKRRPIIIGEWSLGLAASTFKGMAKDQNLAAHKSYAQAQFTAFKKADGWFFWTYKTETKNGWNFRHCVESGLLPSRF